MADIAKRFPQNPLLRPADIHASEAGLEVACLLNPGVFRWMGKTWLLVRVAERPTQSEIVLSFPIMDDEGKTKIMEIPVNDADLIKTDARVVRYKGIDYLTTLSHLRLLSSDDGIHFSEQAGYPPLFGKGPQESFGIEDCRITHIGQDFFLTYTAVSINGVGIAMRKTRDWQSFTRVGMILPPHNKDCAIFEEKINGRYYALHRPSSVDLGGNYIWLMQSRDLVHWGHHQVLMTTRPGSWDSARVGAGAAPIKTVKGWLEIYHGATAEHRYCLGAVLLDLTDPSKIIARTSEPIMEPSAPYEIQGFFGKVVYTNGHVLHEDGDTITVYYGASDEFVCAADFSMRDIFAALNL